MESPGKEAPSRVKTKAPPCWRPPGRARGRWSLPDDLEALESWLTGYFGQPVFFRGNPQGGFPDDTSVLGPTVISTATLEEVASWFPGLSVESARTWSCTLYPEVPLYSVWRARAPKLYWLGHRVYETPGRKGQPPSGRKTRAQEQVPEPLLQTSSARRAAAFLCRGFYTHGT